MYLTTRLAWLALLLLVTRSAAVAAPPTDLLAPGAWSLATVHSGDASLQTVPANGAPGGGDVLRITVRTPATPIWDIQIIRAIPSDVPNGHLVQLHFWARSGTKNPLRATIEQSVPPFRSAAVDSFSLTPEWREYTLVGSSPGLGSNALSAHFQLGERAGNFELAKITVTDIGGDPLEPEQVRERIEKYRKGELTIKVVDSFGRLVPGVTVTMTQTRHAFLFGCNFFELRPADASPAQVAYRDEFAALFNYATLGFYWGAYESQPGKPDHARVREMARWCTDHGIVPKGHPLVYHQVWPVWAPNDPSLAIPLLQARVSDLVVRYRNSIHYWDIVNEATGAAEFSPANGESLWIKRDGAVRVVETVLGWAKAAEKQAAGAAPETFIYNDYETRAPNLALLERMQADGKLPDAIGIQSHMHAGEWPLTQAWLVCEAFSRFGRPIHFTETTVLSGAHREISLAEHDDQPAAWDSTEEGEARQADYVAQFYSLPFSHPAVRAITWWDFSDAQAWLHAPAGLVRTDMTPKPAYNRLLDLIHKQWWTKAEGKTSLGGLYTQRVFYGDYQITVTAGGRTKTQAVVFPEAAPPLAVTINFP